MGNRIYSGNVHNSSNTGNSVTDQLIYMGEQHCHFP